MSKALGAAFLSHQVEQLESKMGKLGVERSQKGPVDTYLLDQGRRGERDADSASGGLRTGTRGRGAPRPTSERAQQQPRRTSGGADSHFEVIVLDSSVLIHALDQVTKWCKPHRSETLIVPLEGMGHIDSH